MTTNQTWLTTIWIVLATAGAPLAARAPAAGSLSSVSASVIVPSGTALNVRLTESIDVHYTSPGTIYQAVLDDPVIMHGAVVIPRGARVRLQAVAVKQSGTLQGSDRITLKANSVSFHGRTYDVATSYVHAKGKSQGKRTLKKAGIGAGLGAAFGGLVGGGSGAAIGAGIGGGAGAVVAGQSKEHLWIPAETRFQFQLNAAVRVRL
jgi:hypothetical protein